ncbi:MAG TPA: hypothetical protein VK675_04050 [Candidatus Paceibacterota bacterium]|nr:hypothetical protein [Candidatus Paceibacterota bacterium]
MDLLSANVVFAASERFDKFLSNVNAQIINPLISFLFALALVYFLYGMFEFIAHGNNDEKKTSGKSHMLWGVIGITVMMGVWAILGIILNTFGLEDQINPKEGTVTLPDYNPPFPP